MATLEAFLGKIEARFGKARRTWLMDRGIPTQETLAKMRTRGIQYLVGTPKGRLSKLESALMERPWSRARESVGVKMLPGDGEFYVYVESRDRVTKERSMRRRRLKHLWKTLKALCARKRLDRDELLMALGAAKKEAGRAWGLVEIRTPQPDEDVNNTTFSFRLNRDKLRRARRREGRYLLRSNMVHAAPETVWENYLLLTRIEQAFKDLKGDLKVRPIWHQDEDRIEAHIFVSFLAYCLHTTLRNQGRAVAGGLTTAAILEKMASIQMIDVHLPTTDGRRIVLSRHTQPEKDVALLLVQLNLTLPEQPRPRALTNGRLEV
jgi:transposase